LEWGAEGARHSPGERGGGQQQHVPCLGGCAGRAGGFSPSFAPSKRGHVDRQGLGLSGPCGRRGRTLLGFGGNQIWPLSLYQHFVFVNQLEESTSPDLKYSGCSREESQDRSHSGPPTWRLQWSLSHLLPLHVAARHRNPV